MKIEKINDNQIKCTLTRSDLASRQLKLSELAYGTEKAKGLFQDMMDQANLEFGFDAADLPLMIEAIPVSMDCIILMITKVENPDEVDTKFSTLSNLKDLFAKEESEDCCAECEGNDFSESNLAEISKLTQKAMQGNSSASAEERLYSFRNLEAVIDYARNIKGFCPSENVLYKSPEDQKYYLYVCRRDESLADFARICASALEFGSREPMGYASRAYMNEHFEKILEGSSFEKLSLI